MSRVFGRRSSPRGPRQTSRSQRSRDTAPCRRRRLMRRFPNHTIDAAPEGWRPILQKIADSSPTKRPLNVHAQMAHSPAVLAAYAALRAVTVDHGTLEPKVSWALNLATASAVGNLYMIGIASRFAGMNG